MKIDISVIIPTYNRLWALPKAIASCQSTQCEIEIIVVDDGSTDGTWEWLQYQKKVIALRQSNLGKCWAVNRAFQIAKGKYIRFLDSDDWIAPNANEQQFQIASTSNADVVVGGYQVYSEEEILLNEVEWIECNDFLAQQLGECNSSHYSAYLFRKDFIEDIPHRPDFTWRDDRLFVLEVAMKKPKIDVYKKPSLCHRHHSQDRLQFPIGMRSVATNLQHLTIYRKCLSQLSEQNELTVRRKKAAIKILWTLAHWIAYTHLDEASEVVDWIYQLDPNFKPPESGLLGQLYCCLGFASTERLLRFRRIILK